MCPATRGIRDKDYVKVADEKGGKMNKNTELFHELFESNLLENDFVRHQDYYYRKVNDIIQVISLFDLVRASGLCIQIHIIPLCMGVEKEAYQCFGSIKTWSIETSGKDKSKEKKDKFKEDSSSILNEIMLFFERNNSCQNCCEKIIKMLDNRYFECFYQKSLPLIFITLKSGNYDVCKQVIDATIENERELFDREMNFERLTEDGKVFYRKKLEILRSLKNVVQEKDKEKIKLMLVKAEEYSRKEFDKPFEKEKVETVKIYKQTEKDNIDKNYIDKEYIKQIKDYMLNLGYRKKGNFFYKAENELLKIIGMKKYRGGYLNLICVAYPYFAGMEKQWLDMALPRKEYQYLPSSKKLIDKAISSLVRDIKNEYVNRIESISNPYDCYVEYCKIEELLEDSDRGGDYFKFNMLMGLGEYQLALEEIENDKSRYADDETIKALEEGSEEYIKKIVESNRQRTINSFKIKNI